MELAPGFCLSDSSKFCFFLSVLHVIRREPHKTPAPAASFLIPRIATVARQTVSPLSWRAEKLPVATPTPFAEFSVTYFCKSSPFLLPFTSLATGMGHQLSGGGGGGGACWLLHSSSLSGYLGQRYNSAEHSGTPQSHRDAGTPLRESASPSQEGCSPSRTCVFKTQPQCSLFHWHTVVLPTGITELLKNFIIRPTGET